MKKLLVIMLILVSCQTPQEKNEVSIVEESIMEMKYSKQHKIDKDAFPLSFFEIDKDHMGLFPGHVWQFSRTKIQDLNNVTDSLIFNAKYEKYNYEEIIEGNKRKIPSIKISEGEMIYAINNKNLNRYYAVKFEDINKKGVQIRFKTFETDEIRFERYNEIQVLKRIMDQNDFETLEKLSKSNPAVLNKCINIYVAGNHPKSRSKMNLLRHAIEYSNKELFNKLLALNVDINDSCTDDAPVILFACKKNKEFFVRKLLSEHKKLNNNKLEESIVELVKKRKRLKHLLKEF